MTDGLAISTENLTKTYRGRKLATVHALQGVNLAVNKGEIFGFLGPNGAGKSTTIKLLMGLILPTSGSASILGVDARSHLARTRVGYLPENPSFYDYLSAEEYLYFVGRTFRVEEKILRGRVDEVLRLMELWDARKRQMRGYSKGMVQRVGLAQVLIHEPDVYILDEPMSGLDPLGRALVKDIILGLKRSGKTVFFSTHITSDVETVCDRVGIIMGGTLRSVQRVETILTEGITGYRVQLQHASGEISEELVPTVQVAAFIAAAEAASSRVTLIEPHRKNLENFFLDMVKGSAGDDNVTG